MPRSKIALLAAGGLIVGVCLALVLIPGALQRILPAGGVKAIGQATIGGPFTLTRHDGKRVTDADFRGKYMLVYFGFTHCPDVCPTALQVASAALDKVGSKAAGVTPVFVSVDPERDTPESLKDYVSSFHKSFVGLTGSAQEIAAVAKSYRVYYQRVNDAKSTAGYTFDHSSIIYLMGPDGKFVTHFTHATSPDTMATALAKYL
jgi:cytochrome oxidase Cu insertion factor (SCO1/SenC/PrrC family)